MVAVFSEVLSFCKLISFSVLVLYNWTGLNFHAENSKYVGTNHPRGFQLKHLFVLKIIPKVIFRI